MTAYDLLIIDPQNDFLDIPGAALPVPGAQADMDRLATWLRTHADQVGQITVTLDSHASVGVERVTFWQQADGSVVPPFTVVSAADLHAGRFRPRDAGKSAEVLAYLRALESGGQRQLVVWPVHCVVGGWGHNIHAGLLEAINQWEFQTGRMCLKVLKGQNPMTEQYSAFKAEVPRADDPNTELNRHLVSTLSAQEATLLIAGEALSHCVAASVTDLLQAFSPQRLAHTVLLTDCMSPVVGFEAAGDAFLAQARAAGLQTCSIASLV